MSKVGQSPSLADLHLPGVRKYKRVLGEEKHAEFTRAIGLHAHGVGIGAFVYMRRVFERLIEAARDEVSKDPNWDRTAYVQDRMEDRILSLQDRLPAFLVENRALYAILSRGIHELTEAECLEMFEPIRVGIELILDEQLEQQSRAEKIAKTTAALGELK